MGRQSPSPDATSSLLKARLVLPPDVVITPVSALPADVRRQIPDEEGSHAVTRRRSRKASRVVPQEGAELLDGFRSPITIVNAVIAYSRARGLEPQATLVEAFPMLQSLINAGLLAEADSAEATETVASFESGDTVGAFTVHTCIQVLEDSETYEATDAQGHRAALKIAHVGEDRLDPAPWRNEAEVLARLDGRVNPKLLDAGVFEGRPYVAVEWCAGVDAIAAAAAQRASSAARLRLCRAILDAYAHLHEQGVIHGDVHPRNLLVDHTGAVKIIDYALSRCEGGSTRPGRGGVAFFFEPEYARAALAGEHEPPATHAGEQYALAALVYLLLTGKHPVNYSAERETMLRQIAEEAAAPFPDARDPAWCEVEPLILRALSKDPARRFPTVGELALKVAEICDRVAANGDRETEPSGMRVAEGLLDEVLRRTSISGPLLAAGLASPPICSVTFGAAGIAYALYRIACTRADPAVLSAADLWSMRALRDRREPDAFVNRALDINAETIGRVSPYHTDAGLHAVRVLVSNALGDVESRQAAIGDFVEASTGDCESLDVTLGRSGILIACAALLDAVGEDDRIRRLGDDVLAGIWRRVDTLAPVRESAELSYLGIAHGWAGIIYAALRWRQSSAADLPRALRERLDQLAESAEPVGRGSRFRIGNQASRNAWETGYMSGWCHGSAGHVFLWTLAHRMFGDERYLRLAERTATNSRETPNTVASLCCGLAGQSYAMLRMYNHTGDKAWLSSAREMAATAAMTPESPEAPADSLYKGLLGVAVLAADLGSPETAAMPFFEQEQ
jgi:hypothetical protein